MIYFKYLLTYITPATMLRSLVNVLLTFPDGMKGTCWITMKSLTTEMSRVSEIEVGECIFQFLALIATFTEKMFSTNMCLVEMHHPWLSRHYSFNLMLYLWMRQRAVSLCIHCLNEEETFPHGASENSWRHVAIQFVGIVVYILSI